MLACVCPGMSSADHTLNTLRYAEKVKERTNLGHTAQNTFSQSEIDEQLKLFKRQNSLKQVSGKEVAHVQPTTNTHNLRLQKTSVPTSNNVSARNEVNKPANNAV